MSKREVLPEDGIQVFIPPARLRPPQRKTAHMKVLIAEDDPDVRTVVRLVLRLNGHQVIEAHTPSEALLRSAEIHPDLIVLDLTFPGADGFSVLRGLREAEETGGVPIIVISGRAAAEDQLRGLEGGADVYLAKPFDPLAFIGTVEEIARMTAEERADRRAKEVARLRMLVTPAG
jgi:DNA-binding response OmpR family regulator